MGIGRLFIVLCAILSFSLCESAEHQKRKSWKWFFCLAHENDGSARGNTHGLDLASKKKEMSSQLAACAQVQNKDLWMRLLRSVHESGYLNDDKRFIYELACRYALLEGWIDGAQESYNQGCNEGCFLVLFGRIDEASDWNASSNKMSNIAQLCIERGKISLLHEWTKSRNIISNPAHVQRTFNDLLESYTENLCASRDALKDSSKPMPLSSPHLKWQKDGLQYLIYAYGCELQEECKISVNKLPPDCPIKSLLQAVQLTEQERSDKLDALLRLYGYNKGSRIKADDKRSSIRIASQIVRSASSVTTSFASGSEEALPTDPVPERSLSLPEDLSAWFKERGSRIAGKSSKLVKVTKQSTKKASSMVYDAAQKVGDALGAVDTQTLAESDVN